MLSLTSCLPRLASMLCLHTQTDADGWAFFSSFFFSRSAKKFICVIRRKDVWNFNEAHVHVTAHVTHILNYSEHRSCHSVEVKSVLNNAALLEIIKY